MTEIETTINDAIEGGWGGSFLTTKRVTLKNGRVTLKYEECEGGGWTSKWSENLAVEQILLDPTFWQAVEKHYDSSSSNAIILARAKHHAGIFMSNLMEGGSIEDVLKQLYENRTRKNKG